MPYDEQVYRDMRRKGMPASLAYHHAARSAYVRAWMSKRESEYVESPNSVGWRTYEPGEGYVVRITFWYDEEGITPDGIEDDPALVRYYAEDVRWMGYVVETFDSGGRMLNEDACWGYEINFPGHPLQDEDEMAAVVGFDRWVVDGKPAPTVLEMAHARARTELAERAYWQARGVPTE